MGHHKRLLIQQMDREDYARRTGRSWEDLEEWEQKEFDQEPGPQLVLNLGLKAGKPGIVADENPTDEPPPPFGEP